MFKNILKVVLFLIISSQALATTERCYYLYRDEELQRPTQELLKVSENSDLFGVFANIELRQANYVMAYGETVVLSHYNYKRVNLDPSGKTRKYSYHGDFESHERTAFGKEISRDIIFGYKSVEYGNAKLFYKEVSCLK